MTLINLKKILKVNYFGGVRVCCRFGIFKWLDNSYRSLKVLLRNDKFWFE